MKPLRPFDRCTRSPMHRILSPESCSPATIAQEGPIATFCADCSAAGGAHPVITLKTSHMPMLTQPGAPAEAIIAAAK